MLRNSVVLPVALPDTAQASVFVFFRFLVLCFFGHFSEGVSFQQFPSNRGHFHTLV